MLPRHEKAKVHQVADGPRESKFRKLATLPKEALSCVNLHVILALQLVNLRQCRAVLALS